ncbi:hypothetical protein [Luteibacter sp. 22Crub2.1]|uniref:hypothetical protein n=1 Tax=Luteibacter sp. 22Crub2.1 TaxID=1283288 RepID=UPI00111611A4|nr:hypothetical protein [Luteibacter sp. 22Crub2.1]
MRIVDSRVSGGMCHISAYGNRIDCPLDEDNVEGSSDTSGKRLSLEVRSTYGDRLSNVTANLDGTVLHWRMASEGGGGTSLGGERTFELHRLPERKTCLAFVRAPKTYFFDDAGGLRQRRAYLLRDDMVEITKRSIDLQFANVSYENDKHERTSGWLSCGALAICPDKELSGREVPSECLRSLPIGN